VCAIYTISTIFAVFLVSAPQNLGKSPMSWKIWAISENLKKIREI